MATIPASENVFPELNMEEVAAPGTPPSGQVVIYCKSDGKVYSKDDAGTETELAAASAALTAHLADTTDAHDASAISVLDTLGSFTATDVEAALAELFAAIAGGGIAVSTIDAKGDILAGTANDAIDNLAVGSNGLALIADSSQATGLRWGVPAGLLAVKYNVTGGNVSTTSATQADVDATNSVVTFTAPASGNVLVRVTASCNMSNAVQNAFFGLRESTTNLVNGTTGVQVMQGFAAAGHDEVISWVAYLTGVSAGSHTYKLAYAVAGGATLTVRQAAASPVTMEVWAA